MKIDSHNNLKRFLAAIMLIVSVGIVAPQASAQISPATHDYGVLVWVNDSATFRYMTWDTSSFTPAANGPALQGTDVVRHVASAVSDNGRYVAVVAETYNTGSSEHNIYATVWDSYAEQWIDTTLLWTFTDGANIHLRHFNVIGLSENEFVAIGKDSTSGVLNNAGWLAGTGWTVETDLTKNSDTAQFIDIVRRPGTNNILLCVTDEGNDTDCRYYEGQTPYGFSADVNDDWTAVVEVENTTDDTDNWDSHAFFDLTDNTRGAVIHNAGNAGALDIRAQRFTVTDTTIGYGNTADSAALGDDANKWIVVPVPGNDDAFVAAVDIDEEFHTRTVDVSPVTPTWTTIGQVETDGGMWSTNLDINYHWAMEFDDTRGVLVWSDDTAGEPVHFRRWTIGGGLDAEQDVTGSPNNQYDHTIIARRDTTHTDDIIFVIVNDDVDVATVWWDGDSNNWYAAGNKAYTEQETGISTAVENSFHSAEFQFYLEPQFTISGSVFSDEGATALSGVTVSVAINGVDFINTDDTNANGSYTITNVPFDNGDVITVYLEDETANGVAVTISDRQDLNIDIYQNYLILRHENGGDITNADLNTAAVAGETDISQVYSVSAGDLTVGGTLELFISTNGTFVPGGDVTAGALDINGNLAMGSSTFSVAGEWDATGGDFSATTGTVIFTNSGGGTIDIISNGNAFANIHFNDGGGGTTFELEDALDVNGTLRIQGGTLNTKSGENNSIMVDSNWVNEDNFTANSSTVTLNGTMGSLTITTNGGAFHNLVVAGTGDYTLQDALDVNNDLTLNGTLDVSAANNYEIMVGGSWSSGGTFLARNGTVTFDAASGKTITSNGESFYNIDFNGGSGTWTLEDNLDVNGTLRLNNGTLDANNSEDNDIALAGNWIKNSGSFIPRKGEVIFDGAGQTILGSNTFYDFTKLDSIDDSVSGTLFFEDGVTTTITNIWNVQGLDSDDMVFLRSVNNGTQWDVDPQGMRTLGFLEVRDSNNTSGTTVDCTNGCTEIFDNNFDWNFISVPITISGTLYSDEGISPITTQPTVAVSINGGAIDATDVADAMGGYSITTVSNVGATAVLTIFIDGAAQDGVVVTVSDGADMNDVDIYQNYLIVRQDNNGALTNTNLAVSDNLADADFTGIYSVTAGNTLELVNGNELMVFAGHAYEPGEGVSIGTSGFSSVLDVEGTMILSTNGTLTVYGTMETSYNFEAGSGTIDINGTLVTTAGTFKSTSGVMAISGVADLAAGTFVHNSGIVRYDGNVGQTISSSSNTFNTIEVTNASAAGVTFDEAFTTADFTNITVSSKMFFQQLMTFTITDELTINGASGNEIVLDSVNQTQRFTFDIKGGGQSVTFVDVDNSQADTDNITALNSIEGANTDAAESAPRWVFVTPPSIQIATGRFTLMGGTGTQDINVGFAPSAYVLFLTKNAVDDTDSLDGPLLGSQLSIGMTDGTRQFCMMSGVEDGLTNTSDVGRRGMADQVVCNMDVGDGSQNIRGEASHQSFLPNGFRINIASTAFTEPTSPLVQFIAFGGADLNVYVDSALINTALDGTVDITAPNFEPDVVLTSFIGNFEDNNGDGDNDDDSISFGWAVNSDIQTTGTQFSIMKSSDDGLAVASGTARFDNLRAACSVRDPTTQDACYDIGDFDSQGFTITTRVAAVDGGGDNYEAGYMALKFGNDPQVYSTQNTARTTTGNQVEQNARFQPIALIGIGSASVVTANNNTSGSSLSIGITDGTTEFTMMLHDEDSTSNTNTHSRTTNTQFLQAYAHPGTVDWAASLTSFDTNGWTLNYGNAATTNYLTAFLAIGLTPAPTTINGTVYTDEGLTNIGPGKRVSLSINGTNAAQTTLTDTNGEYSFTAETSANDVIIIYLDDETEQGALVTVTDGNLLSGISLFQNRLIVQHNNSGSLTNSHLATADNNGDSDITDIYTIVGSNITVADGFELFIPSGHTYVPGGTVSTKDIDINGTFTMAANDVTVSGTWDAAGGVFTTTGLVTFDSTESVSIISNNNAFNDLTVNGTGTFLLEDALDVNDDLTITTGTLDVKSGEDNQVNVGGNWSNADNFLARTGSVIFDGATADTIISGGKFFYNVDFNGSGTWTLEDKMDVNGTLKISSGMLDANSSENNDIELAGNWINFGTFEARNGEVILDGDDNIQTISGTTIWYDFSKMETTNNGIISTVTFSTSGSQTILGTWNFTGLDSDDQIGIEPTPAGSHWFVDPRGTRALSYLNVLYSNNVNLTTVDCTNNCTDLGNNINWNFTSVAITVSGTVFVNEGITPMGASRTVSISINGAAVDNTDLTNANGEYSITTVANVGAGAVLTLWLDDEAEQAATVTLASGMDLTGVDLYQDYLIIRADNGGSITNINLNTANNVGGGGDADIDAIYTVDAGNNVALVNGKEMLIWAGDTYAPGNAGVRIGSSGFSSTLDIDGTMTLSATGTLTVFGTLDSAGLFTAGAGTLDVNGTLNVSAGTFTSSSGLITISGLADLAAGTFVHNSGIVRFDGAVGQTVSSGSNSYNEIQATNASTGGVTFDEAFTTEDFTNTTVSSTMFFQQGVTFTINDEITISGGSGTEINIDSVDQMTQFTFDVKGGNQSVVFVNVDNSITETANITANNSIDGGNTDSSDPPPHWIFPTPANISIATGRFTIPAGTGAPQVTVTGVGFTPSAYILFATRTDTDDTNSAEGSGNGSVFSIGMAQSAGSQFCMASGVEDNQTTVDVGRRGFADQVICNIDMGDGNQTPVGEAEHNSFTADGFVLDRNDSFTEPADIHVQYIAFGGADLQVDVGTVTLDAVVGNSVNVTAPNFEPDVVITSFIGNFQDTGGGENNDHSISFGWAVNSDITTTAGTQFSITTGSVDNQADTDSLSRFDNARAGASFQNDAIDSSFEITDFDSQGFSVFTRLAAAGGNDTMGYIALDFGTNPQVYSVEKTAKTTTGNQTDTDARFQPIFLLGIGTAVSTTANSNDPGGSFGVGITDGADTFAMTMHDEDAVGVSNTHSRSTNTQFFSVFGDGGIINYEATFSSFSESGWTINYGDAATTTFNTAFLAIGTQPATATIAGTLYADEGSTPLGSRTIALSINGAEAIQTTTTSVNGTFDFTVPTSANDIVIVYVDGEIEQAATVTVSNGSVLANYNLYKNRLIVRNDNSGSTTNANIAVTDNGDTDISDFFSMSGNQLTVAQEKELLIWENSTFAPGDTVTVKNIDINGIFAMASNHVTVSGTWDAAGGSFTSSGTVTFDATEQTIIISDGDAFHNVHFNGAGGLWILEDALDVNGTLKTTTGTLDVNVSENNQINIAGHWINQAGFSARNGTVVFDAASGSPTITTGGTLFYNIDFNDAGNNIIFTLEDMMDVNGTLKITGGTLDANSMENNDITVAGNWINRDIFTARNAQVTFDGGGSHTIESGSSAFNDVMFNNAAGAWALEENMDVNGDLTLVNGSLDANTLENNIINIAGNWSSSANFIPRNGTVIFDAAGAVTIISMGDDFYHVQFNNAAGSWTLEDDMDVNGNFRITAGIFDTNVLENNSINTAGNWVRTGGTFTPRLATVTFDATGGTPTILSGGQNFYNFALDDGMNGVTFLLEDALNVNGTVTITEGNLDVNAAEDNQVNVAGNWINNDTFTARNGTVIFDGDSDSSFFTIFSGASAFNNIEFNMAGGTWILQDSLDVDGDLTNTTGTLDVNAAGNYQINVAGKWENNSSFFARAGTVLFDGSSGTPTILSGGNNFYNIEINGSISWIMEDNLDINGTLLIISGTLDANNAENNNIALFGNWLNFGGFAARGGDVTFDGIDKETTVSGTTTFFNLFMNDTTNNGIESTVTFSTSGSQIILGQWNFSGLDATDMVNLRSSNNGSFWYVDPQGTRTLSFLRVRDSFNVNATVVDCTNNCAEPFNNNINWNFVAGVITISGTVFTDEGLTTIGVGRTISVSINGQAVDATDTTNASGEYTINTVSSVGNGAVITLWIDGAGEDGVTVTLADGNNMTGIDIYQNYLTVRSDNGTSLSNINLNTANNVGGAGDADIDAIYDVSTGNTLTLVDGKELLVFSGETYRPGDAGVNIGTAGTSSVLDIDGTMILSATGTLTVYGTLDLAHLFTAGGGSIDINGAVMTTAGTFTSSSGVMTIDGTLDMVANTFVHNSGIVRFDGATAQSISASNNAFNEIQVTNASTGGITFLEAFTTEDFTNTTVSSTMFFAGGVTFTINDALTLSGANGSEIVLDSTTASQFDFDVKGGAQTVIFVNVSNSQASTNNITANNSIEGINTDSGAGPPHWIFATPANLEIATGRFTLSGGTGTVDVTSVGFTPSAYILFLSKNDTDDADSAEGAGNGGMLAVGMTDGARQFCMATGAEDDQSTSDVGRRGFSDRVLCNIDVGDETQSVLGEASHSAFIVNGFRINRNVAFSEPTNVLVHYVAFGGGDLNVRVDTVDLADALGGTVDVTGPGFEPDVVLTSFIGQFVDSTGNSNNDDHSFSLGWALNPSAQTVGGTQFSVMTASEDNVGTTNTMTRFDSERAGTSFRDGAIDASYTIGGFDSSGFTVTTTLAAAVVNEFMGYMALELGSNPQVYSKSRTARTALGNDQEFGAGFTPVFLMGLGGAVSTAENSNDSGGSLTIGLSTAGTNIMSMAIHDEDNVATSNTHTRSTITQFMSAFADDGTVNWEATFSSFDTSGWTLNYGDAASSAFQNAFLAIGLTPAPTTITGTVYSNEGITNIGSGKSVSVALNGSDALQTVVTGTTGQFNFTVPVAQGDVVTLYLDDETENGATVTIAGVGLLTADIYQDYLIVRNDNSSSTTNANLDTADNNGDTDISDVYSVAGGSLTMVSGVELFIQSAQTFAPGGGVTAGDIDINGVFTMAANEVTVSGTWDAAGGSFTSSGTVVFDGNSVVISNGSSFFNIEIGTITVGGTITTNDNLDVNGTMLVFNGGTTILNIADDDLFAAGAVFNLTNLDTFTTTNSTVQFDGSVTQSVTAGTSNFNNLVVTNTGTVSFLDDWNAVDFTNVTAGSGMQFNAGSTYTISSDLVLTGLNGNEINLISSITNTRFTFDVTGSAQNVSFVAVRDSQASTNDITATNSINNGGNDDGDAPATAQWIFTATGNNYVWTGNGDMATWEQDANWTLAGDPSPGDDGYPDGSNDAALIDSTNHTIDTDGALTIADLRMSGTFIGTLTLDGTTAFTVEGTGVNIASGTLTVGGTLDINGTLNLSGTLDLATNNGNMNVSGSITVEPSGIVQKGTGTVTFDGNLTYIDRAGGTNFGRVVVDPTTTLGSDFTADSVQIVTGDTLVTDGYEMDIAGTMNIDGTLDATSGTDGASTIAVGGTWDMTGGLFLSTDSTVMLDGTTNASIFSGGQSFNNLIINDGLVGYWKLNETSSPAIDSSGYGNNATWFGASTVNSVDTSGTIQFTNPYSIELDGGGDYLEILATDDINVQNFTFSAWFKSGPSSSWVSYPAIFMRGNNSGNNELFIGFTGAVDDSITVGLNNTLLDFDGNIDKLDQQWHHIGITYDTVTLTVYVDGAQFGTPLARTDTLDFGASNAWIGADVDTFNGPKGNNWDGFIDDVRLYNRALSSVEIGRLAAGTQPSTAIATYTLENALNVNGTLTLNTGELDVNNGNDYSINVGAGWLNHGGVFTERGGVVTMDAGSLTHIIQEPGAFSNLTIDDSSGSAILNISGTLDVDGTLNITDGTLDATTGNWPVEVAGNWINSDTFTSRNGTVTLDGSILQTVTTAASVFYNVNITNASTVQFLDATDFNNLTNETAGSGMVFNAGSNYTIAGTLNLNGQATGTRITLDSSNGSTRFAFDVTAADQMVSFVDVSNSEASSNDIIAVSSLDNVNTDTSEASPHWIISQSMNVFVWTGANDATTWEDQANWTVGDGTPGDDGYPDDNSDKALIESTSHSIVTAVGTLTLGELEMAGTFTGILSLGGSMSIDDAGMGTGNLLMTANGTMQTALDTYSQIVVDGTFTIGSTSTVVVRRASTTANSGEGAGQMITAGNMTIDGTLSANGQGFAMGNNGPGGTNTDGGTYGGVGRNNPDSTYGSFTNPVSLGSGGKGSAGGGAIILLSTGTITINGTLSANAEKESNTCGSGGSINITAATLTGTGAIQANGGDTSGITQGGGGRVSLAGVTNDLFSGRIEAHGDSRDVQNAGHAGTIYLSNDKRTNLVLGGAGNMSSLRLGSDDSNDYTFVSITVQTGGTLIIDSNPNRNTPDGSAATINITTLDVQAGGIIDATEFGFDQNEGPGSTPSITNGASHGGLGYEGPLTSTTYGSIRNPTSLGSGGHSGKGGGAIILNVSGMTTVNGTIRANGSPSGRPGSGGSVNITTDTITGAGEIQANGSTPGSGRGSGGGRVAVILTSGTSFGTISYQAYGGEEIAGIRDGAAGTVYLQDASDAAGDGELIIDNDGIASTVTTLIGTMVTDTSVGDVTIQNAGNLAVTSTSVTLTVSGTWTNNATQTFSAGTIIFDGPSGQNVTTNAGTFYHVEVTNTGTINFLDATDFNSLTNETAGSGMVFNAGSTYTIGGILTLNGQAEGTRIILNSSSPPAKFAFSVDTLQSASYVSVNNSEVSGSADINAAFSLDNNTDSAEPTPHWVFVGGGPLRGAIMVVD